MSGKRIDGPVPNISGSYQIVSEEQRKSLKKLEKEQDMDEKSIYYARIFMED